jgi:hypothetical protein
LVDNTGIDDTVDRDGALRLSCACERAQNGECQQRFFHVTSFSKNSLEDPHLQSDGQTLMLLAAHDCTLVDRSHFLDGSQRLKWQLLYFLSPVSLVLIRPRFHIGLHQGKSAGIPTGAFRHF